MCFVKCKFDQRLFKKKTGWQKIKGVRVGGLKIKRNSDKKISFKK
jgi:hypothetical protein